MNRAKQTFNQIPALRNTKPRLALVLALPSPVQIQAYLYPNVAKVGGLQSQGGKGAAVPPWRDCKPLTIPPQAGESSGFPPNLIKWGEKR
jgi:hypothetical protein